MDVKVLGPGCSRCKQLYAETQKAIASAGLTASVEKVEKIDEIMRFGVMSTPALVIDGEVKSTGKVLSEAEITTLLTSAMS